MEFSGTLARKWLKIRTIRANVRRSKHNYHALAPDFALREPFSRLLGEGGAKRRMRVVVIPLHPIISVY
jgi:hypothetical protein